MRLPGLVTVGLMWAASIADAQQSEDLRRQLEQLKQEYQQKIQDMEKRLAALEQQNSQPTAQAVEATVENAAKTAVRGEIQTFQGQLPSGPAYDLLQEAETKIQDLEHQTRSFEFHG